MKSINWLARLAKLRINRAVKPPSPHKPLFMLCVLDLYDEGQLRDGRLLLTSELYLRFQTCWIAVKNRSKQPPIPQFPFHYLSSDGFWRTLDAKGKPSDNIKTTKLCLLDSDFLEFLDKPSNRETSRRVLLQEYFTEKERIILCEALEISLSQINQSQPDELRNNFQEAIQEGRDARFRIRVVHGYLFTCALTGHRLVTASGASLVEAAHIHAFADSRSNDPENGLALSRNAHWLFDKGLWTVETKRKNEFLIRVATEQFDESSPFGHSLKLFDGRPLFFAPETRLRPNFEYFAWHREKRFLGELVAS
jgi:putative restriction endonuclease